MKVVIVNTTGGKGSTVGELISGLADGLRREGFTVRTAVGRGEGDLVLGGIGNHRRNAIEARIRDNDGFIDRQATRRLCTWLTSECPDVVHLHNLHGYYLDIRILFKCLMELSCRVIVTMHDNWLLTGHCAVIPSKCKNFTDKLCHNCNFASTYPAALRTKNTYNKRISKVRLLHSINGLTLVTPSRQLARLVMASDLADLKTVVIPNGVNEVFFNKKCKSHKTDLSKLRLLAVSRRWLGEKNYELVERLSHSLPDGWKLTIVGDVSDKTSTEKIKFEGIINSTEKMAELYTSHDVVICPSLNESFGLVVAEALACGTPVVVNSRSASAELLNDNDGLIDDFTDIESLINTIRLASQLSPTSHFTMATMVTAYAKLFNYDNSEL